MFNLEITCLYSNNTLLMLWNLLNTMKIMYFPIWWHSKIPQIIARGSNFWHELIESELKMSSARCSGLTGSKLSALLCTSKGSAPLRMSEVKHFSLHQRTEDLSFCDWISVWPLAWWTIHCIYTRLMMLYIIALVGTIKCFIIFTRNKVCIYS